MGSVVVMPGGVNSRDHPKGLPVLPASSIHSLPAAILSLVSLCKVERCVFIGVNSPLAWALGLGLGRPVLSCMYILLSCMYILLSCTSYSYTIPMCALWAFRSLCLYNDHANTSSAT